MLIDKPVDNEEIEYMADIDLHEVRTFNLTTVFVGHHEQALSVASRYIPVTTKLR